ncbi:MAG: sulfur carrier protein ThiS [Bacteroidota bacterium]
MDVYINSKLHKLHTDAKVTDALAALDLAQAKGIAIAINNDVVPRGSWNDHILQPGDKVTLIRATQGG